MGDSKPRVIILGGLGFVGRNMVTYLVEQNLCSKVRVVDKVPPQTAWLNEYHKEVFSNPVVEFKSGNLTNPAIVEKVFTEGDADFDYCINCAAETRYGLTDEIYKEGILKLSQTCARQAAKSNVKMFIELSTAQVYSSDKKPSTEESKTSPWTLVAKHKLSVEEDLKSIDGLNYVIVRPAIIYGVGDQQGLTPRLIIGAVYKQLSETMKLLWTKDLKMNTVHVKDVCSALWLLAEKGEKGAIYNLSDKSDSTQGSITELVCEMFGIQHDYFGTVLSNLARVNMSGVVDDSNEQHLSPWSDACSKDGILNTPLTPYLDQELLYEKHLSVDGSKIESLGFKYEHPVLTKDSLQKVVSDYVELNVWPPSLSCV